MIKIEITNDMISLWGAGLSTFLGIIKLIEFYRDKAKIKIIFEKNKKILNNNSYDINKKYFIIKAINLGRRPIKIIKAGMEFTLENKNGAILAESFLKNKILKEEDRSVAFIGEQNNTDFKKILYVYVEDDTGKKYKKYLHKIPTFWYFHRWLKQKK